MIAFRKLFGDWRLYLLSVLLASVVEAQTTVSRHLTPTCSNNGDGTSASCAASAGAVGAYTTLANAISDMVADNPNLVSADIKYDLEAHAGTDSTATSDLLNGFTTDATRTIRIWSDESFIRSGASSTGVRISDPYVTVEGLEITNSSGFCIQIPSSAEAGTYHFLRNKLRDCTRGIDEASSNVVDVFAINNMMSNCSVWGYTGGTAGSGQDIILYNNTCYGAAGTSGCYNLGLSGTSDSLRTKNNLAQNCGSATCYVTSGSATTLEQLTDFCSDTSCPTAGGDSKTCTFVNAAGDDLHLDAGDTVCKNAGTDLSADATYPFSNDYDNETRTGTWDVGVDELMGASSSQLSVFEAIGEL